MLSHCGERRFPTKKGRKREGKGIRVDATTNVSASARYRAPPRQTNRATPR